MIQNQFARRNLSNYVRGGLGLQLEGFYKKKAEENLKFGGRPKESEKGLPILANLLKPEIKRVDTREEISKVSGISHGNIDKIKEIKASAPAEVLSELEKKLITGEISINQAHKFVRTIKAVKNNGTVARKILEEFDKNPSGSLESKTKDVIRDIQREERDKALKEAEEKKKQAIEAARKEREEKERIEKERIRKEREEKERQEKES